jgi:tetratricopeptide (TPR) repeat protein
LAEQVLVQEFRAKPWLVVEGLTELSAKLYEMGEREGERAMLSRARTLAQSASLPRQLALVECTRAFSLTFDDQLDSARGAIVASRAALANPGAAVPLVLASCVDAEGQLLVAEGKIDSAIVLLKRAVALSEDESARGFQLRALMDLSLALRANGQTREAAEIQLRVIADRDAAGFRGSTIMGNVMTYITGSLYELGELALIDSIARAAYRAQAALPGGHSNAFLTFGVGLASLRRGEIDSAEVWLARAARMDTSADAGGLSSYLPPATTQLRLEQGRLAEARASIASLPSGTLTRRVNRAWLTAWLRYAEGDRRGAIAMLEDSLRVIRGDADKPPPPLTVPLIVAAEWRLAAGDARAADSLALLGRAAAAIDSAALERSAYVGRAELVRGRARLALGDTVGAREAADRAIVAAASGYGPANRHTLAVTAFRKTLR